MPGGGQDEIGNTLGPNLEANLARNLNRVRRGLQRWSRCLTVECETIWMSGMDYKSIRSLAATCVFILFAAGNAWAQAETSAEASAEAGAEQAEENGEEAAPMSDEDFAKSLVGKTYSGSFALDGWINLGGGLVLPPFYVQHYNREDGTILVLTAKETEAAGRGSSADFEVTDALTTSKPRKGYTFSTACMKGEDYTLRFLGEASGKDSAEWWTNLRKAWEINIETGEISSVKARGVKCTNPDW